MTPEDATHVPEPPAEPVEVSPGGDLTVDETAVLPLAPPPSIADGILYPLDPRHVTLKRWGSFLFYGILSLLLLGGLTVVLSTAPLWGWVKGALVVLWIGISLALARLSWRWPEVEHRHSSYRVDEQGIEIRRGVYWRQVISVPRSRVQHTDVSQGPLERSRGLGTLVIYTAGTDHAKVELAGLSHETALAIRDHLLSGSLGGDAV